MPSTGAIGTLADRAADVIRQAFAGYMAEFDAISRLARTRFENRDWPAHRSDVLGRLELYPGTVGATVERLEQMLGNLQSDRTLWIEIKSAFTRGPADPNSELAQTFYNSITRRIFKTVGVNPEIEFASLDLAIRDWDPDPSVCSSRW